MPYRIVCVDILLWHYDRFGARFTDLFDDIDLVNDILNNPKEVVYLGGADKYLTDLEVRKKCDEEKKKYGYTY